MRLAKRNSEGEALRLAVGKAEGHRDTEGKLLRKPLAHCEPEGVLEVLQVGEREALEQPLEL